MNHTIEIVRRFAPVLAHKVTREWSAADTITRLDLAGDITEMSKNPALLVDNTTARGGWRGRQPAAAVYFSICETHTHYFPLYTIYHPMDWWKRLKPTNLYDLIRDGVDEHAHDMEGLLMVVRKAEPEPILDAMITVAHSDFYLYTEPLIPAAGDRTVPWKGKNGSLLVQRFNETVDGHIWIDGAAERPKVYIQSRGHGIYGDHKHWGGGDETWYYYPDDGGQKPMPVMEDETIDHIPYTLIDLFAPGGLWEHRQHPKVLGQRSDGKWGFMAPREVTHGKLTPAAANPPWSWNDKNDPSPIGEIATDPARLIGRYAQGLGPLSHHYLRNPYWGLHEPAETPA